MISFSGFRFVVSGACLVFGVGAWAVGVSDVATCGAQMDGYEAVGLYGGVNALASGQPASTNLLGKGAALIGAKSGEEVTAAAEGFKGFLQTHPEEARLAQGAGGVLLFHDARALKDMIIYSENPGGLTLRLLAHHHGKAELRKFMTFLKKNGSDLPVEEVEEKIAAFNHEGKECLRSAMTWNELAKNLDIPLSNQSQPSEENQNPTQGADGEPAGIE